MRVFAALVPSDQAVEHLQEFLSVRQELADPALRWARPYQWHVTLAFAPDVAEYLVDDISERLASAAGKRRLPDLAIAGGGAFPDPDRAKVLWAGLAVRAPSGSGDPRAADPGGGVPGVGVSGAKESNAGELSALAAGCRAAFATAGAPVDGQRFRPHLTVARLRRPGSVTRWVRLLDAYDGPTWSPDHVTLIHSHLGEGPRRAPRYEELARLPLV